MAVSAPHSGNWRRRRRILTGKRAIVTGASSGLGRAVALALSRRGCHVLATARRADRLEELAAASRATVPIAHAAGDLCDPNFRSAMVIAAARQLGGIDLVISAAGAGAIGPFRDTTAHTFARIIDLDFNAHAELIRDCLPHLTAGNDSAIVFVGSILGLHPLPLHGEYAAAKAALRSLAGSLRLELAADKIDVMLATLGPIDSEFWGSLVAGQRPTWSRGHPMPADQAAAAILSGLERRRAEIIPGWRAQAYAFLARFAPGLIDRAAARNLSQARDVGPTTHHETA